MAVLVVDDDKDGRESVAEILQELGFPVLTAANGGEAISVLKADKNVSLVLLDLRMPHFSGHDFLEYRRSDTALSEVPVVVMSAMGNLVKPADVVDVLSKPFSVDRLQEVVIASWKQPFKRAS